MTTRPAFLFLDALDAARSDLAQATYRKLIEAVLALDGWRVIASVRSFDLRMGRQFRAAFTGEPPDLAFAEAAFDKICHVHVPVLAPDEVAQITVKAPAIATALNAAGPRLSELIRNPFILGLLTDLLAGGVDASSLASMASRGQLLERYWQDRVGDLGLKAESVLARVVERMLDRRATEISAVDFDPSWADALDELARRGVVVREISGRLGFRHHMWGSVTSFHFSGFDRLLLSGCPSPSG